MEKGIHKVRIGDDFLILLFEDNVEANNNIVGIKNDIDNINKIISQNENKFKNASIKEIEGRDHLDVLNYYSGDKNDNQSKK